MEGIPVFRPSEEEFFGGFEKYVAAIEPVCQPFGLGRIIPPASWRPTKEEVDKTLEHFLIPNPIEQHISGIKGIFQQINFEAKPMNVREYQQKANERASRIANLSEEAIERVFWKTVRFDPPIYGADVSGSVFNSSEEHWNIMRLDSTLRRCLSDKVQGVTTAYLYFGMWKAMFSWHTEDMDLSSINYIHFGAPKRWYVIPESDRERFEQLAAFHFPDLKKDCPEFLRHKTTMISPSVLRQNSIRVYTTVQHEREIIITLPGAYHSGFNMGFNCAESVNFALESWIPKGLKASVCRCRSQQDSVFISMGSFIKRFEELTGKLVDGELKQRIHLNGACGSEQTGLQVDDQPQTSDLVKSSSIKMISGLGSSADEQPSKSRSGSERSSRGNRTKPKPKPKPKPPVDEVPQLRIRTRFGGGSPQLQIKPTSASSEITSATERPCRIKFVSSP